MLRRVKKDVEQEMADKIEIEVWLRIVPHMSISPVWSCMCVLSGVDDVGRTACKLFE